MILSAFISYSFGKRNDPTSSKSTALSLPTQAKEVYDVTGAGDTVISVLATAIADGRPYEEACYLANAAAGVVVGKLGTSTITPVELENAIHQV